MIPIVAYSRRMLSITVDSVKNIVTASSFAPLVVGLLIFLFVANKIVKMVVILIAVALGVLIFSQRSTIDDCVTRIKESSSPTTEKCKILGYDVSLDFTNPVSTGA